MTEEAELRAEALKQANMSPHLTTADIVSRAEEFYKFLKGAADAVLGPAGSRWTAKP